MIIYQIKLPKKQDAEAFATFMREEYIPAVHKGATRVGKVTSLTLLQGSTDTGAAMHEFFFHVGFGGLSSGDLRIDGEEVPGKLKAFGARFKRLGSYREIASWPEGKNG